LGFAVHGAYLAHAIPGVGAVPPPIVVERGMRVVETDHAFNLLFRPAEAPRVVRRTDDSRLALLTETIPQVPDGAPLVFEAEAEWPPLSVTDMWAHPTHNAQGCVSRGRTLALHPIGNHPRLVLELTAVPKGSYSVTLHTWSRAAGCSAHALGDRELPGLLELDVQRDAAGAEQLDRVVLGRRLDDAPTRPDGLTKNR
jgi:hypothetical protein